MSLAISRPEIQFSLRDTQTLSSLRAQGMWLHTCITHGLLLPLDLAAQECEIKRKQLQQIRDERALDLGKLLRLQGTMERLVHAATSSGDKSNSQALQRDFGEAMFELVQAIGGEGYFTPSGQSAILLLNQLTTQTLPRLNAERAQFMTSNALRRPSRLARQWPRLLLLPPLTFFAIRYTYNSRASLAELGVATAETLDRFWHDWLLEPLRDVVRTVRAGSEERVLISARGVAADIESLERMSLALAKEKLGYSATQLEELSELVKEGDLTPVLRIYEEDIRNPLRSAVSGTLLRSVFIQVQKAKVRCSFFGCWLLVFNCAIHRWTLIKHFRALINCLRVRSLRLPSWASRQPSPSYIRLVEWFTMLSPVDHAVEDMVVGGVVSAHGWQFG